MKKVWVLLLVMLLCREICFGEEVDSEARWSKFDNKILTLLNEPEIGGVAEFKITPAPCITKREIDVTCDIPVGWELINEQAYIITGKGEQDIKHLSRESRRIRFWKGYVNPGEIREIFFQARIPDGEDYILRVYGGCDSEFFELDLGQPEPPDFRSLREKIRRGTSSIYEIVEYSYPYAPEKKYTKKEEIPYKEGQYPPILGELKARTKHNPYVGYTISSEIVPLRYLVYTDIDIKEAVVTIRIPSKDLKLIDSEKFDVTKDDIYIYIKFYQSPMKAKESKAFYFKVRSINLKKDYDTGVAGEIKVLTDDGRKLVTEDWADIPFRLE